MSLLSKNIRTLREKNGLKLSDFEQYGIKAGTMSNYELGKTEPKLATIVFFSNFFKVDIGFILLRNLELLYKAERGEQLTDQELLQYQLEKQEAIKNYDETRLLQNSLNDSNSSLKKLQPETTTRNYNQLPKTTTRNYNQTLLDPPGEYKRRSDLQNVFSAKETEANNGIPLIPITAIAGPGRVVFEDLQVEQYYIIPELKTAEFMVRMKGNSMYPKYSSGDILACVKVLNLSFFQWNKVYAVYTESQGVMIKRIHQGAGDNTLKLVSDNPSYPPFEVPKEEIKAVALVVGCVRVE